MHGDLRRWQAKDQVSAIIDLRQPEDIAQERAVGFWVRAADNGMRTDDDGKSSFPSANVQSALALQRAKRVSEV